MRRNAHASFELRGTDTSTRTFSGYASVWDTIDSYGETIASGAFRTTLREWHSKGKLPKMLLQHGGGGLFGGAADDMVPIGKWEEMREDGHGLFVRGRLFDIDTARARAVYAAMKEGELDGLSIGFRARKSTVDERTGIRTITDIDLLEVSIVLWPANDPARIGHVKSTSGRAPFSTAVAELRCELAWRTFMKSRARVTHMLATLQYEQALASTRRIFDEYVRTQQ